MRVFDRVLNIKKAYILLITTLVLSCMGFVFMGANSYAEESESTEVVEETTEAVTEEQTEETLSSATGDIEADSSLEKGTEETAEVPSVTVQTAAEEEPSEEETTSTEEEEETAVQEEEKPALEPAYSWKTKVSSSYTGLAQEKSGTWYYLKKGKPDLTYSNLVKYNGEWFYVHNGKIDWSYSTLSQVNGSGTWYYVKNGRINWDYMGLAKYYSTWYYIENGRLNWGYNGLIYANKGWYYVKAGRIDWNYSNLVQYGGKWFYVHNGKIDWSYSTLSQVNGSGTWYYVKNGQLDWSYTGLAKYYSTWYYIEKGRLNWGYNGLAYYGGSWFYVKGGRVDWSFTGLAGYQGDYYYMENGKLNWGYNGKASLSGYSNQFDVKNGKVLGGRVAPSPSVAKKADNVLNSVGWNLRAAFNWASKMPYSSYIENGSPGVAHFANYGFDRYTGNCYVYAAMFVAMARELGYEAYQISGHVRMANGGLHPHSWTEVKVGNTFYVFDPNFSNERYGNYDGYQIYYGKSGTWQYAEYYRMNN